MTKTGQKESKSTSQPRVTGCTFYLANGCPKCGGLVEYNYTVMLSRKRCKNLGCGFAQRISWREFWKTVRSIESYHEEKIKK